MSYFVKSTYILLNLHRTKNEIEYLLKFHNGLKIENTVQIV